MKISYKKLKKELDKVFSQYIRIRDFGVCYTCGDKKHWKRQQNGHFIPRNYLSLRWNEVNCHCQCVGCNVFRTGAKDIYAKNLVADYGPDILERLQEEKQVLKKYTKEEIFLLVDRYKQKINEIIK